jgi:hypothetical protein
MHDDSDTQFLGDEAIVKRSSSFIQDGQVPRNHSRNQVPRIRSILRMRGGWGLLIKSGFLLAGMSQALEPGKDVVENTGKSEEKAGGVAGKPQRCKSMQIRPTRGVFRAARPLPASHPAGLGVGRYSRTDIRVGCRRCHGAFCPTAGAKTTACPAAWRGRWGSRSVPTPTPRFSRRAGAPASVSGSSAACTPRGTRRTRRNVPFRHPPWEPHDLLRFSAASMGVYSSPEVVPAGPVYRG